MAVEKICEDGCTQGNDVYFYIQNKLCVGMFNLKRNIPTALPVLGIFRRGKRGVNEKKSITLL